VTALTWALIAAAQLANVWCIVHLRRIARRSS